MPRRTAASSAERIHQTAPGASCDTPARLSVGTDENAALVVDRRCTSHHPIAADEDRHRRLTRDRPHLLGPGTVFFEERGVDDSGHSTICAPAPMARLVIDRCCRNLCGSTRFTLVGLVGVALDETDRDRIAGAGSWRATLNLNPQRRDVRRHWYVGGKCAGARLVSPTTARPRIASPARDAKPDREHRRTGRWAANLAVSERHPGETCHQIERPSSVVTHANGAGRSRVDQGVTTTVRQRPQRPPGNGDR